jgi:hypothetical protein
LLHPAAHRPSPIATAKRGTYLTKLTARSGCSSTRSEAG